MMGWGGTQATSNWKTLYNDKTLENTEKWNLIENTENEKKN